MVEAAREVSLLLRPGELPSFTEGLPETLAGHLEGRQLTPGQRLALPGWPSVTVEHVDPPGSTVQAQTRLDLTVPPGDGKGPLNLAILVDASLTMGQGPEPTPYQRAAHRIDGFLMNGRAFLAAAGIVVQGGETRHVEELASPETLSGAAIHRVSPRGTFALASGLTRALDVLEAAEEGPRAILLVTDGDVELADPLASAGDLVRAGTTLLALTDRVGPGLEALCAYTGGLAAKTPEAVFEALAERAGARSDWLEPSRPGPLEDPEFQAVIETMEENP